MRGWKIAGLLIIATVLAACGGSAPGTGTSGQAATVVGGSGATTGSSAKGHKITLGAYSTPKEAYGQVIPAFKQQWKAKTGEDLTFEESYQASGAQSRAIVEGFDADVAALSLQADIDRIAKAGLITHDWTSVHKDGMISTSIVVLAVRPGNPKGIKDWADLAKPGINVLTPNPKTSGGAQWNIMALYGAALRGQVAGVAKGDDAAAQSFLKKVLKNVSAMDKGGRESITTFEKGVGDVAITYENEVLVAQKAGEKMDMVIPHTSILIENPVALVDSYVDKHGNRQAVEAFINYLFSPEAQKIFADYGLRSVDAGVAQSTARKFPPVADQFTIRDFSGWASVSSKFFADNGIYSNAIAEVQR